ncbi:unnamed protein product [Rhizophagus irregularis]|nr:unnamed protein product [Rhizophagus irregularis]
MVFDENANQSPISHQSVTNQLPIRHQSVTNQLPISYLIDDRLVPDFSLFDLCKLDKQDNAAAYQTFYSANLKQCLTHEFQVKEGMEGFAIYLFIMGEIVNCYLNRNISPIERIRMVTTGYFFLYLWHFHIETLSQKYPNFISIKQNFLANQSFTIFTSLCESMVLLIKAH